MFVGFQTGQSNTSGGFNTFVGSRAGPSNTTGVANTFVGDGAGGVNTGGMRNVFVGEAAGNVNTTGSQNTLIGYLAGTSGSGTLTNATAVGANANVAQSNSLVLGSTAGVAGGTQTNSGLNAVMRLRPLRYEYKRDNALEIKSDGEHVGFSAQDVQRIIPEAVSTSDKGYLLVNNDPILWTMLNAIKEQQQQIEQLKGEVRQLRAASVDRHVSDRQQSGGWYEAQ